MIRNGLVFFLLTSCLISCQNYAKSSSEIENDSIDYVDAEENDSDLNKVVEESSLVINKSIESINFNRSIFKLSHHINTIENESRPVIDLENDLLFFTGLDRTGFFDFKLDFIIAENAGGEDIFYSSKDRYGHWNDARPIKFLNSNRHESISSIYNDEFLLTANYKENIGIVNKDGVNTSDIFIAKRVNSSLDEFQVIHFPEPVNSLFTEADPYKFDDNTLLFVSDRPGHVGDYHKKGWKWNDSFWGNTDIWVTFKKNGYWTNPTNLGELINTPYAERTPYLSKDGLSLYLSSNGYESDHKALNVYKFTRTNKNDWENWNGPIKIEDISTDADEFGYIVDEENNAYFTRAEKLGFTKSNPYNRGDGGVFEINFRTGYTVLGLQAYSYSSDQQMEIYQATADSYDFLLPDIMFDFDSDIINDSSKKVIDKLIDFISINSPKKLIITGFTDNIGETEYNNELSLRRARSISNAILPTIDQSIAIQVLGKGELFPMNDNSNEEKRRANRRVEVRLFN